jgi:hypothetical protein
VRWRMGRRAATVSCAQKPSLTLLRPAEGLPCNFRLFWGYYCNFCLVVLNLYFVLCM